MNPPRWQFLPIQTAVRLSTSRCSRVHMSPALKTMNRATAGISARSALSPAPRGYALVEVPGVNCNTAGHPMSHTSVRSTIKGQIPVQAPGRHRGALPLCVVVPLSAAARVQDGEIFYLHRQFWTVDFSWASKVYQGAAAWNTRCDPAVS